MKEYDETNLKDLTGKTLGQIAYEAYVEYAQGKSLVTGVMLPIWDNQGKNMQEAWQKAAEKAINHFLANKS